jgi:hypothetical protein
MHEDEGFGLWETWPVLLPICETRESDRVGAADFFIGNLLSRRTPRAILRGDIWVEEIGKGLTELKVRVKQPAVEHRVRMKDFRRWLESQGRTPAECTRKRRLLALAKGEGRER